MNEMEEQVISLSEIFEALKKRWIMIVAITVAAAFIGGLIVGIGGVIMMMYFNNTFKSKKSLEEELGLAVLGTIPDIESINV